MKPDLRRCASIQFVDPIYGQLSRVDRAFLWLHLILSTNQEIEEEEKEEITMQTLDNVIRLYQEKLTLTFNLSIA